jgi:hypothetical protein
MKRLEKLFVRNHFFIKQTGLAKLVGGLAIYINI